MSNHLTIDVPMTWPARRNDNTDTASVCDASIAVQGITLILRWIRESKTKVDRASGLDAAMDAFDHSDEAEHGRELREGVAQTICSVLIFALSEASSYLVPEGVEAEEEDEYSISGSSASSSLHQQSPVDDILPAEIIAKSLSVMEMIHRCSLKDLRWSFDSMGIQLLPLLLEVMDLYVPVVDVAAKEDIERSEGNDEGSRGEGTASTRSDTHAVWAFHCVYNAMRLITYFSSLSDGQVVMGGHRAYLDTLMVVLGCGICSKGDEVNEIVTDCLNVLGNYHKVDKLVNVPGLFDVILLNIGLNDRSSDEAKEAVAHFFKRLFERQSTNSRSSTNVNKLMAKDEHFLQFITKSMLDPNEEESTNWVRCSAVKAAHLLCVPPENAKCLVNYKYSDDLDQPHDDDCIEQSFLQALIKMVLDGSESFSAACGLCHLAANSEEARFILNDPLLLDTLAKTALTNPNAILAGEAVEKILPSASFQLFRRIVLLMTLNPNFCHLIAIRSILSRACVSLKGRYQLAGDECIIMILVKASRNDANIEARVEATKALKYLSIDEENKMHLLEDSDIVEALAKAILDANFGTSSSMSMYHESSAYATCAICNLVVDEDVNSVVVEALTPSTKIDEERRSDIRCNFVRCRQNLARKVEHLVARALTTVRKES